MIEPNQIKMFFHCKRCLKERPAHLSPREWVRLEVGRTDHGIQVWCIRHDLNVVHIQMEVEHD